MDPVLEELRKLREVHFGEPHPDPRQAHSAVLVLQDVHGILDLHAPSYTILRVAYNVRIITLRDIEGALSEVGFHLDNSLLCKLRRTLWYYADDTDQANLGCEQGNSNCTRRIFVDRYTQRQHGCRDIRPQHWRRYW